MNMNLVWLMFPIFGFTRMINIVLRLQGQELGVSVVKQYGYYYASSHPDTMNVLKEIRKQTETTTEKVLPQLPMMFNDIDLPLTIKLDNNCFDSLTNKQNIPNYAHISLTPSAKFATKSLIPEIQITLMPKHQQQAVKQQIKVDSQFECIYQYQHITEIDQIKIKQILAQCINRNPSKVQEILGDSTRYQTANKIKITSSLWSNLIKITCLLVAVGVLSYHYHVHADRLLI